MQTNNVIAASGERKRVTYNPHTNVIKVNPSSQKFEDTKRSSSQIRGVVSPLDFTNLTSDLAKEMSFRDQQVSERI